MVNDDIIVAVERILVPNGDIFKIYPFSDGIKSEIAEIYISQINPGSSKGWRVHKEMECNLICISGTVKLSYLWNGFQKIILSDQHYQIVRIGPSIPFNIENQSTTVSGVMNFSNQIHSADEVIKIEKIADWSG